MQITSFKKSVAVLAGGLLTGLGLTSCINIELGRNGDWTLLGLLYIALVIYALIQVIDSRMSSSSKLLWVLGILFFPFMGSVAWFIFGRR